MGGVAKAFEEMPPWTPWIPLPRTKLPTAKKDSVFFTQEQNQIFSGGKQRPELDGKLLRDLQKGPNPR